MKKFVNLLTLIRIIAVFLLPFLWDAKPSILILFVIFVLLTDFFDGLFARKFHVQSLFGAILDTVADKLFGISILLLLGFHDKVFFLVAFFELMTAFINLCGSSMGAVTKSSMLGKTKMWLIGSLVVMGIIVISQNNITLFKNQILWLCSYKYIIMNTLTVLIVIISSITMGDYIKHIWNDLKTHKRKSRLVLKDKKELKDILFNTNYYLNNRNLPLIEQLFKNK